MFKKLVAVMALVVALAMPTAEAHAVAPVVGASVVAGTSVATVAPFLLATTGGMALTYVILTNVDPWTPLLHGIFGDDVQITYSYPAENN